MVPQHEPCFSTTRGRSSRTPGGSSRRAAAPTPGHRSRGSRVPASARIRAGATGPSVPAQPAPAPGAGARPHRPRPGRPQRRDRGWPPARTPRGPSGRQARAHPRLVCPYLARQVGDRTPSRLATSPSAGASRPGFGQQRHRHAVPRMALGQQRRARGRVSLADWAHVDRHRLSGCRSGRLLRGLLEPAGAEVSGIGRERLSARGSSVRQRSNTDGQRGWKRQPVGTLDASGSSPWRITRFSPGRGCGVGTTDNSERVYGCWGFRSPARSCPARQHGPGT